MVVEAGLKEKPDEVDAILAGKDGQIQRPRDPKMCHHNARQKCAHCLPIDPYDEEYLKSKEIKHLSFHSHIRKLTEGSGRGSQLKKPLENISCSIDLNCPGHKPYPKGVCTKCRPATVTLNRQRFRHVDNVMMENEELVNAFLDYWRRSGHQRVGYLIGTYQEFADVPLGMKATVVAIYEPPQTSSDDGVQLEEDRNSEMVDKMCGWLGLKRVGWIFTDLWSADKQAGTVHCTRHKDSFLLSASECITAADMQNKHPNPTVYCTDGYYGSKFVTVVASGDESMAINFHGYQVSNQCASLVAADLLCPTNHPELAYVREKPLNDTHYLTDVQFTEKNEYGAEVRRDGRPLPVEFLMVDVPAGMPLEKRHTFHVRSVSHAIENREAIGELQGGSNLSAYCAGFSTNEFLELATNFHFLIYLATNPIVKFSEEELRELCSAVLAQDRAKAVNWARDCGNWQTLVALANEQQHHAPSASSGAAGGGASHAWNCAHCTFENQEKRSDCAMCGLPATA